LATDRARIVTLSTILSGLSYALDLTEGHPSCAAGQAGGLCPDCVAAAEAIMTAGN
jgi:hypothetical protein